MLSKREYDGEFPTVGKVESSLQKWLERSGFVFAGSDYDVGVVAMWFEHPAYGGSRVALRATIYHDEDLDDSVDREDCPVQHVVLQFSAPETGALEPPEEPRWF